MGWEGGTHRGRRAVMGFVLERGSDSWSGRLWPLRETGSWTARGQKAQDTGAKVTGHANGICSHTSPDCSRSSSSGSQGGKALGREREGAPSPGGTRNPRRSLPGRNRMRSSCSQGGTAEARTAGRGSGGGDVHVV